MNMAEFIESVLEGNHIAQSEFSNIFRARVVTKSGSKRWLVRKCASTSRAGSREPHDIKKELRILSQLSHENIIEVLGHNVEPEIRELELWMPYVPISLSDLLDSPSFLPHKLDKVPHLGDNWFAVLAKSILFQIITALAYLHESNVAHRDIKPHNFNLTVEGCAVLYDFGVAFTKNEYPAILGTDLWPEDPKRMYYEVSTGAFCAPELFFSPRSYDAFAIDLWSFGVTMASFFSSLREHGSDFDDDLSEFDSDVQPTTSSVLNKTTDRWERSALFDSARGPLGTIAAIFRRRGTPTVENWPEFRGLPDALKLDFIPAHPVKLSSLLPHLSPSVDLTQDTTDSHFPPANMEPTSLDLIHRFLVYPSEKRLKAREALRHPWFTSEPPMILPRGFSEASLIHHIEPSPLRQWKSKTLGEWLKVAFPDVCSLAERFTT